MQLTLQDYLMIAIVVLQALIAIAQYLLKRQINALYERFLL